MLRLRLGPGARSRSPRRGRPLGRRTALIARFDPIRTRARAGGLRLATAVTSAARSSPRSAALADDPSVAVATFDEAARRRGLERARDPREPVRGRARPRRDRAREGHVQQPRPARERARDRRAPPRRARACRERSVSESRPERLRPSARLARGRHVTARVPRPRRRGADGAHRRRPGRQGGKARRSRGATTSAATPTPPAPAPPDGPAPDRRSRLPAARLATAAPIDDLGRRSTRKGEPVDDARQGPARPRRTPAAAGSADQGLRARRRAIYGFEPHIDGGWYRCCGGHVRKLVDCCAYTPAADQRRRGARGLLLPRPQGLLRPCTSRPRCPC